MEIRLALFRAAFAACKSGSSDMAKLCLVQKSATGGTAAALRGHNAPTIPGRERRLCTSAVASDARPTADGIVSLQLSASLSIAAGAAAIFWNISALR